VLPIDLARGSIRTNKKRFRIARIVVIGVDHLSVLKTSSELMA